MKRTLLPTAFVISALMAGCNDNDGNTTQQSNTNLFQNVLATIGGQDALTQATTISYNSTGISYEFQEDPEPINGKVADARYSLIYSLDGARSRQHWQMDNEYAYEAHPDFVETIDGTKGTSVGVNGFFPENFAGFGVQGDPMYSTKMGARQKSLMMSSPLALLKLIDAQESIADADYGVISVGYNVSSLGYGSDTPDIELVLDGDRQLPIKAITLENDPLLGDVMYEVSYSGWETIEGLQVPTMLEHTLDGNLIRTETLSNIDINPMVADSDLTVTTPDWEYSETEAKAGYLSSQFHYRTIMQTFPIDFPVEIVDATVEGAVPSEPVANDPDVYRVSGSLQSHYSYAFRIGDELLIYDAPANNRRTLAVNAKIRSDFSTLPIRYVVLSHNHFDHTGGWRGALAEGGDLVVGSGTQAFMDDVLQRPHTVLSNPLQHTPEVIGVNDKMVIGTGVDQVELHTVDTHHAEEHDYVVVYKPATKTLYFNDMVNPGFVFVFDSMTSDNQRRTIELAKDIVEFVDDHRLDVTTYYATHGFVTQDFDFQTVRDLAARSVN